jgi:hypothetical protein
MNLRGLLRVFQFVTISVLLSPVFLFAQAGFDDDRIVLQGFYWESYRHGTPDRFPEFGEKKCMKSLKTRLEKFVKPGSI